MSFIAKNPLVIPEVELPSSRPLVGTRGLFASKDGWHDIDPDGTVHKIATKEYVDEQISNIEPGGGGGEPQNIEELERLIYYGNSNIVSTNPEYFIYECSDGVCYICGVSQKGVESQLLTVVYPYEINGCKVVEIRNDALKSGTYNAKYTFGQAETVIIPSTVTRIGDGAFSGMNLSSIYIPDSVTKISGTPFCGCPLESIRLSENLQALSNALLYSSAKNLEYLYIPDSVEFIDNTQPGVCIMGMAKYVSIPHHFLYYHASPIDVSDVICEIRGGEEFKVPNAPCFGSATNVRVIFPRNCKVIDGLIALDAKNCVFEIPSSVIGINNLAEGSNNTIVCEQGSTADYWGQDNGFNVKYDVVNPTGGSSDLLADKADKDEVANALKGYTSGNELITLDDISPIEHNVVIGVADANIDPETVTVEVINADGVLEQFNLTAGEVIAVDSSYPKMWVRTSHASAVLTVEYNRDVNVLEKSKADKSDSLEGYGITNAYNKREVYELLQEKANRTDVVNLIAESSAATDDKLRELEEKNGGNTDDLWERGVLNPNNAIASNSSTKIYTKDYIPTIIKSITADSGYVFELFAFDGADNYIGSWNVSEFSQRTSEKLTAFDFSLLSDYDYRYKLNFYRSDKAIITPEDSYTHIHFHVEIFNEIEELKGTTDGLMEDVSRNLNYIEELSGTVGTLSGVIPGLTTDMINMSIALEGKKSRPHIENYTVSAYNYVFQYNDDIRLTEDIESISLEIPSDVYPEDYISGLSFNSGDTPTHLDYTGSGILNWVGTDCSVSEENGMLYSVFQPSANTHYDIVFYFNGSHIVGVVNGFVPVIDNKSTTGNVVSE